MKKYFMLFAAAATVLAVSCNKGNNGASETPDVPPVVIEEEEDNTPIPIEFGTKAAEVKAPATKAAIDNWSNVGQDEKLYVYGLERTSDEAETYSKVYINNVAADAPENGAGLDTRSPINVYEDADNEIPFYYIDNKYYDFYAYFVADAAGENEPVVKKAGEEDAIEDPTADNANPATITLDVEIDGTQDIMLATTDKASDEAARADRSKAVTQEMMYSAKSARRGVKPNLNFEHQLSRFVFNIKAANVTVANGVGDDKKGQVTIQGLTMSSYKKGTLTIVGEERGLVPTASTTEESNIADLPILHEGYELTTEYTNYGEVMIYPESTNEESPNIYNFTIKMAQEGSGYTAEEPYELPLEIKFEEDETALAGKKYEVNVIVYGLEEVQITVSLKEWEDGDEFILDPDNDGETPVLIDNLDITLDPAGDVVIGTDATIGLNWDNISVATGETTPDDEAKEALAATLYCKSSDTGVARVYKDNDDGNWKVKGITAGEATITVSVGNSSFYGTATLAITVAEPEPEPEPVNP